MHRARGLGAVAAAVYLFLYAPLLVLVAFSFNRGRLSASWDGFTLDWYARLAANPALLTSLRNTLVVALATTALATVLATAGALAFHRHRFRHRGAMEAAIVLPMVVPEIVLAGSLLLLFAALGLRLGFLTLVLAHVGFSVSYAVVVVRARLAGFERSLEEAAMDLGAGPWRTLLHVTFPAIAPGVLAAALLVFALSVDDYVVSSFVAGVGSTTLPLHVYSMVKSGVSPEINAASTLLLVATSLLLFAAWRLEQGRRIATALPPALAGLLLLAAPFLAGGARQSAERELNLYIWSGYIAPETIRRFEERHGARVNLDLYDSNEALLAKVQAGNAGYDVLCPSNYVVEILLQQRLLRALDHSALPHLVNMDPRFLDRPFDPGNRYSVPYVWGTAGIGYRRSKAGRVDSWAAMWDPRFKGRILMLDDARESLGAALKWKGYSLNTVERAPLLLAQRLLIEQKPLVRTYNTSNYEDILLSGDVWLAQGWSGQFAKAMDQDADIDYVIPREGTSLFLDNLVIPADAPHPELAHAFLDYVMEPAVAAEICATMRYSTPNHAAVALLPEHVRRNPATFPPADALARAELILDIGEATVVYDRLWTEVKAAR
ncbi:MAG TPA: extracellular solute-binding protein [Vicinamibacteria bacterium]|nr:extracellular solute-binding protein [Vicinamibacteria bacterium]